MKKLLLAAALSTFACAALAEDRFYAGGNVAFWNYTEGSHDTKISVSSLEGVAGFNVWSVINIEGRVGLGLESSTESVNTKEFGKLSTELTLDNYFSVYIKPELKNDTATVYALLGVTRADASTTSSQVERDLSMTGLSYGLGMGFYVTESALVNLEFRNLVQEDDYKFQGFSAGFTLSF
jgi:opacity protein-like surface antigen